MGPGVGLEVRGASVGTLVGALVGTGEGGRVVVLGITDVGSEVGVGADGAETGGDEGHTRQMKRCCRPQTTSFQLPVLRKLMQFSPRLWKLLGSPAAKFT